MNRRTLQRNLPIFILLALFLGIIIYSFQKKREYEKLKEHFLQDKLELQFELDEMAKNYEGISTKNEDISNRIVKSISNIAALKDSVKKVKEKNFGSLIKYRKLIASLQSENRNLIQEVDSLNNINIALQEKNSAINGELEEKTLVTNELQAKNAALKKVTDDLDYKLAPAKSIQISPISVIAMREKRSGQLAITNKASQTDAFRINFKLIENVLATPGTKKIHIQLKDDAGNVLVPKGEVVLKNKQTILVSDELVAEYEKEDLEVLSLLLIENQELEKGNYTINVFVNYDFTSSSKLTLK